MWVGRAEEFARPEFATSGLPTTHQEPFPSGVQPGTHVRNCARMVTRETKLGPDAIHGPRERGVNAGIDLG